MLRMARVTGQYYQTAFGNQKYRENGNNGYTVFGTGVQIKHFLNKDLLQSRNQYNHCSNA